MSHPSRLHFQYKIKINNGRLLRFLGCPSPMDHRNSSAELCRFVYFWSLNRSVNIPSSRVKRLPKLFTNLTLSFWMWGNNLLFRIDSIIMSLSPKVLHVGPQPTTHKYSGYFAVLKVTESRRNSRILRVNV